MPYSQVKVYSDGSHYIGIPYEPNPRARNRHPRLTICDPVRQALPLLRQKRSHKRPIARAEYAAYTAGQKRTAAKDGRFASGLAQTPVPPRFGLPGAGVPGLDRPERSGWTVFGGYYGARSGSRFVCVCAWSAPEARSAEGDGAASAAPSAKPPLVYNQAHTLRPFVIF